MVPRRNSGGEVIRVKIEIRNVEAVKATELVPIDS